MSDQTRDSSGAPEGPFDFVPVDAVGSDDPVPTAARADEPEPAEDEDPAESTEGMYAGLIVQRGRQIERIVSWEADELVAGRGRRCDIFLPQEEISRKHAIFHRADGRYEVHDNGSINGTYVNGRRTERKALRSGDVVKIEDFEITFVLDRQPIDQALQGVAGETPASEPQANPETMAMTMITEMMPERTGLTSLLGESPEPGEPDPGRVTPPPPPQPVNLDDLFPEDDEDDIGAAAEDDDDADEEKPLEAREDEGASRATSVQMLGDAPPPRELALEVRVDREALPEPLRAALDAAGGEDLTLPVEIRIRRSGS